MHGIMTGQLLCNVSHNKDETFAMQVSRILKMVHPAQVSAYIKEQQRMALAGVRGRQPTKALLVFYASMENLCSVARPLLDYISLSAIITATAKLWTSAQANSSFKPNADMLDFEMKHLYCSILLQLKPMLPDAKAQAVSNILWSSAKIRLNPDALVPGMTDALAAKVLQLTREDVRRQPNAQDCAIFLRALATLGHDPSDQSLTDAVCDHFAMLIKHHDESKRPSAQNCANFMWAVATLGHEPADQSLADAVCDRFAMLIKHSDESKRPNAGGAANVMWALGRMKHAPADGVASAILERLTTLCDLPGQAPNPQSLSNTLFACAVLRLQVKEHVRTALIGGLLRLNRSAIDKQAYCNAAWSLAVSSMLSIDIFLALLERLLSLPIAGPAHDILSTQQLTQLYQAFDSLQPLPAVAAQQLQNMVTRLGPVPLPHENRAADLFVSKHLCAALELLGLAFTANVFLSGYWAEAVLHAQGNDIGLVVLVTGHRDHIKNKDKRCVKRFVLCLYCPWPSMPVHVLSHSDLITESPFAASCM